MVLQILSCCSFINDKWKMAINNFLPDDIFVNNVELVDDIFHSRYCALYKIYEYNYSRNQKDVAIFEIGKGFFKKDN